MEKIKSLILVLFLTSVILGGYLHPVFAGVLRESISGDIEFRAYYDRISGNEDLSFKEDGFNYLTDLYLYYQPARETTNGVQYRGMLYLQGTDDPQYQTGDDNWRVQNIYLTATRPEEWELTGGFFSNRYTQYTMNSTLLGLDGWIRPTENFRFKLFAGREHRARRNEQYARYAGGFRAEVERFENHLLGFNYVRTEDQEGSLDSNQLSNIEDTAVNTVYSFDYTGSFLENRLRIDGEIAGSEGDTDVDSGPGYDNESARRIRGRWRPVRATQLTARYEKVDPGFETLQGFASRNRERQEYRLEQQLTENWDFGAEYSVWEDGLGETDKTRDVTTWRGLTAYRTEFDLFGRQEWSFSKERRKDSGNNESDETIWEVGLENRFSPNHRVTIRYFYEDDDADSEKIKIWRFGYAGNYEPYEIPVDYDLNTEYREDQNKTGAGTETDRRWRLENNFTIGRTSLETLSFYHHYQKEQTAGSGDIVRHSYGGRYTYVFSRETGNSLSLIYEETDTTDKEDSNRDYKEQTFELRITASF